MLIIGDYNQLKVARETSIGIYLESDKGDILMPMKYVPEGTQPGDVIAAFIYKDSEDRLIATTQEPYAKVNEFAALTVKDVSNAGAFLDWGLEKDLLAPHKEQQVPMNPGETHVVRVTLDPRTERLIAISKILVFLEKNSGELSEGEQVELLIFKITPIGYQCIINGKFQGILYKNEVFEQLSVGDKRIGYIKKLREDSKIDLSLYSQGVNKIKDDRQVLLDKLKANGGMLPFSDNTAPEVIQQELQMSKKAFKKAIGGLYKDKIIDIEENEIRLLRK